jgi:GH18 family chitinase
LLNLLGGKQYSEMVSNTERRTRFVQNVMEWMNKYKFDGFVIMIK